MCTVKYKNENNTSKNTQIKSDRAIKFRLLNSYSTAGNSNWWPRVLNCMAPGGLGLTVNRWLRQWNVETRLCVIRVSSCQSLADSLVPISVIDHCRLSTCVYGAPKCLGFDTYCMRIFILLLNSINTRRFTTYSTIDCSSIYVSHSVVI